MERRFTVLARAQRQALIATLLAIGSPASARPARGEAKVQFDRGVAAYTKGDFKAAAEALGKSFALKPDAETLFAWAQSERKLDRCDKALELYARLLKFDMPAANKEAVKKQISECKDIIANANATAKPEPAPEPEPKPLPPPPPEPAPEAVAVKPEPAPPPVAEVVHEKVEPPPPPTTDPGHAWWKDPVGDSLMVLGFAGLAAGTGFIVSAHAAENDKIHAMNYFAYQDFEAKATMRGQYGVVGLITGGVFITTSFLWFATHRRHDSRGAVITGWFLPDSGGLAVTGGF